MQIEFFGCTSAGKTTLIKNVLRACQDRGIDALTGEDFVLSQIRLNRIQRHIIRTLLVDILSLAACLATWREHHVFYQFSMRVIRQTPVGLFQRLNLLRNVLKKVGIYEIVRWRSSSRQAVLVDEGTLHAAHNLFVHVSVEPKLDDITAFVQLVPIPDLAVYVMKRESILVERTVMRGHKRIPDRSYLNAERFIRRAVYTFDQVVQNELLTGRLFMIENRRGLFVRQKDNTDRMQTEIVEIICAGIDDEASFAIPSSGHTSTSATPDLPSGGPAPWLSN